MKIESILAVMNTNELVVEIRPEKILACTGFEPMTFVILVQHSDLLAQLVDHCAQQYRRGHRFKSHTGLN